MTTTETVQKKKRNFLIRIPENKKEVLRSLAERSGMTMTQYVETILTEAIENEDIFRLHAEKIKKKHKV